MTTPRDHPNKIILTRRRKRRIDLRGEFTVRSCDWKVEYGYPKRKKARRKQKP